LESVPILLAALVAALLPTPSVAAFVQPPVTPSPAASPLESPSPLPSSSPSAPATAPGTSGAPADPCASLSNVVSRPTVATSPCSVKPYEVLIETGYSNVTTSGNGATSTVSYPNSEIRIGLDDALELDVIPPSYERESTVPLTTGLSDGGFGLHYEFGYTRTLTYGANAVYTTNTGSPRLSANGDGILVNLNGAAAVSPALSAFGTFGYEDQSSGSVSLPMRYRAFAPALGLTLALPKAFALYVEGSGQTSDGAGSGGRYGIDGGVTYDVGTRLQLDAELFDYPGSIHTAHQASAGFGASYLIGPL
jgi:hypothetical protein